MNEKIAASDPSDIEVVSGDPDPVELAALTAVLSHALDELAAEREGADAPAPSAWTRSQRPLRAPLQPGPGAWRGFGG